MEGVRYAMLAGPSTGSESPWSDELRKLKEELEAEIQRGFEGRKKVLNELDSLLAALEAEIMTQQVVAHKIQK